MKGTKHALLATVAVLAFSGAALGAAGMGGLGQTPSSRTPCGIDMGLGTGTEIGFSIAGSSNGIGIDIGRPHKDALDSGITLKSGRTGISTGIAKTEMGLFGTGTEIGIGTESTRNGIGIDTGRPHLYASDTGTTLKSGRTGISTGIRNTTVC